MSTENSQKLHYGQTICLTCNGETEPPETPGACVVCEGQGYLPIYTYLLPVAFPFFFKMRINASMMKEWAEWKRRNGVGEKAAKMKDGLRLAEHGEPAAPDGTALFNEKATSLYEPEQLETFGASFESWMWENISSPDVMGPLLDIILTPVGKTPKFSDMAERLAFTSEEETQTWEALSFFGKSAAGITEKRPKSGESSKSKPEESAATNPSPGPR